jgi:hypothetical protein
VVSAVAEFNQGLRGETTMQLRVLLLVGGITAVLTQTAAGDDGMFPMSELGRLNLRERGLELTAEQLFNPSGISLVDGICRVNGCTGSFVSAQGLIITNHHCAFGAIQKASTRERDLLQDGFRAGSLEEEIPAPDYQVRITEDYQDVSQQVLSVLTAEMSFLERTRAVDRRCRELEQEAEKQHAGLRAEVSEMFPGRTYVLFLYTYLKDVRLVFAPPVSVGNFGGEIDNWEWPRHTGDFSFMRAYTAPDGSSATFAKENIPYRPRRHLKVAPQGVDEGDAVFLLGYPGRTARHRTAEFVRYERDIRLPLTVELYAWQISEMERAAAADREVAIRVASRMRSLANVEKRSRGQVLGLTRAGIVEQRSAREEELQKFIDADASRKQKYGGVLSEINGVYEQMTATGPWEIHFEQLRQACHAMSYGFYVVDAAAERSKADLEREQSYQDRNFEQTSGRMLVSMRDWNLRLDVILLSGMLERLSQFPEVEQIPALRQLTNDAALIGQQAERLLSETSLGDPEFVKACLQKSSEQLAAINDPLLQLLIALYPYYVEMRDQQKAQDGQLDRLYGSLLEVKEQFLAEAFVPDANATLRLTTGRIRAYSPADAVIRTPISTLRGVIEKTTGKAPFDTPEAVLKAWQAGDSGQFRHPRLQQVPVAILYDTDTTGGNSGSPVLNSRGELVGVNFDRCFEATINDFAWNTDYSRSIGVDIRYVLWITSRVYGAGYLLREMGVDPAE